MSDVAPPGAPPGGEPPARPTLRRRSLATAAWSLGGIGAQRGLGLATNLVMTRLLVPEAFGLMAMVVTVLTMAEMVSDIGVRQSVVRSPRGEEARFLRIAWTVQIVRSGAIAGLVLLSAAGLWAFGPALAAPDSVYADPALPALVAVASLSVVMRGLASTALWRAARRLEISRVTMIEIGAQLVSLGAMVGLVLAVGATVWVLLAGLLIGVGAQAAASHLAFRDVRMGLAWDREVTGEMWRFGRWIILSSAATFAANTGDRFVMGALLDAETFGLYAIATIWLQVGILAIDRLSGNVLFGALAETLRERRAAFPRLLARVRLAFEGMLAAACAAATLLAAPLIGGLYTDAYAGAAPILAVLALRYPALHQRTLQQVLVIEGRTGTAAAATVMAACATLAGTPLAWHLGGLDAALLTVALAPLAATPLMLLAARRLVPGLSVRRDAALVAAILMAAWAVHLRVGPDLAALGAG